MFDYSKADFNGICSYLMDIDFGLYLQCDDIEFIWFVIKSLIFEAMYLFIPKISLKHNHGPKINGLILASDIILNVSGLCEGNKKPIPVYKDKEILKSQRRS